MKKPLKGKMYQQSKWKTSVFCCKRMVTIEIETTNLHRGPVSCTKLGLVLSLFQRMVSKALRGAKGVLAPNQDVAFEVIGRRKKNHCRMQSYGVPRPLAL